MYKEEIVYPIFLKCCDISENQFWVNVFSDLSKNITPYGTYISKDYFCCSYKNKQFSYKIDDKKSPEVVYAEVTKLLKDNLKLTSLSEKLEQIEKIKNNDCIDEELGWNSIRKKNSRKILIEKFVISKGKEYELSVKTQKKLLKLIYYFILIKSIDNKNIIIKNKVIVEILGITFSKDNFVLDDRLKNVNISDSCNKVVSNDMYNNWEKYKKEIYKLSQSIE